MRLKLINFLKLHPAITKLFWNCFRVFLEVWGLFVPIQEKTMLFFSFGGRKFDDSPKAIYDEICTRKEFADWRLIWVFVNPDEFDIPRGEKVKIDTKAFFKALLYSHVWIDNSGIDRGTDLKRNGVIHVQTWHGVPLKKIGGEENQNTLGGKKTKTGAKKDTKTIYCAQSEYDREIFSRIFNAAKESILLCDLPRNDSLVKYTKSDIAAIKENLAIPQNKKIILYMPTYREYLVDEHNSTYIAPPMNLEKWQNKLGKDYVLLIRAHYAVNKALNIKDTDFVHDVSNYKALNDLYAVADVMISDYSSSFFDYSILDRPMFCFAYDLEEYEEKRGLYISLEDNLPCPVDKTEDELLEHILNMNEEESIEKTKAFHARFAPFAGNASKTVVDEVIRRLG